MRRNRSYLTRRGKVAVKAWPRGCGPAVSTTTRDPWQRNALVEQHDTPENLSPEVPWLYPYRMTVAPDAFPPKDQMVLVRLHLRWC
jgi:hypothetical protein